MVIRRGLFGPTIKPGSIEVNALSWDELAIAVGKDTAEFSDNSAHLIGNALIRNAKIGPGLLGRLSGKEPITYFWITEKGQRLLGTGNG